MKHKIFEEETLYICEILIPVDIRTYKNKLWKSYMSRQLRLKLKVVFLVAKTNCK